MATIAASPMKRLAGLLGLASATLLSIAALRFLPAQTRNFIILTYLMVSALQGFCARPPWLP
jgi:hypothetical protein